MITAQPTYQPLTRRRRVSTWTILPWTGIGALILAWACGIAALVVGIVSDSLPQNSWKLLAEVVQPSVLLSSAATLANAFLRVTFVEGVVTQWWVRAHRGASIGELHALYAHGFTYRGLFTTSSGFSRVTFAAFAVFLLLADGPLLQKASSVRSVAHQSSQNLTIQVSASPLVFGATGIITEEDGAVPNLYTSAFAQVVQHYISRDPISIPQLNYSGILTMTLKAPGWDVRCENGSSRYELVSGDQPQVRYLEDHYNPYPSQKMFETSLEFDASSDSRLTNTIYLQSSFKSTPGDNGVLSWRHCWLSEALINYPLHVMDGIAQLQPMPLSENRTDYIVVRRSELGDVGNYPSTNGGLWLALATQFATSANATRIAPGTYIITTENAIANQFVVLGSDLSGNGVVWSDPTDSVIAAANEISLRAAISLTDQTQSSACGSTCAQPEVFYPNLATVNRTTSQQVFVTMTNSGNVYQTNIGWLFSVFAIIAFACIAIAPMYWEWWRLDRTFTLDPLETAKAFDAPLLSVANPEVSPATWTRSLKQTRVLFGAGGHNAIPVTIEASVPSTDGQTTQPGANVIDEDQYLVGSPLSVDTWEQSPALTHQFEVVNTAVSKFRKID